MNPLPSKAVGIDYKGTVWYCAACGFTKPRWEKDRVQEVMGGGVLCSCDGIMKVRPGAWVEEQYEVRRDQAAVGSGGVQASG